ncbi:hypothetical protein GCM10022221_61950 [Actinocorallia aurea]
MEPEIWIRVAEIAATEELGPRWGRPGGRTRTGCCFWRSPSAGRRSRTRGRRRRGAGTRAARQGPGHRRLANVVPGDRAPAGAQPTEAIAAFLNAGPGPERAVPPEVRRLGECESFLDQGDPLGALTLLGPLLREHPGLPRREPPRRPVPVRLRPAHPGPEAPGVPRRAVT